jgi:hypothetical protein
MSVWVQHSCLWLQHNDKDSNCDTAALIGSAGTIWQASCLANQGVQLPG